MKRHITIPVDVVVMNLTGLERQVLEILLAHDHRGDGLVFPTQVEIAEKASSGRAAVTRAVGVLERRNLLNKIRQGRRNGYQLAERFLVAPNARRPARSTGGTDQPSLLLSISGSGAGPKGVEPTPIDDRKKVSNRHRSTEGGLVSNRHNKGVEPTPGTSHESKNPSSSTESTAAREGQGAIDETVKNMIAGLRRAPRASGPNYADPAVREAKWMSDNFEHMQRHWPAGAFRDAMTVIVDDPKSPEAKRLLEKASAERKRASGSRGRACSTGDGKVRRMRRPKKRRRAS